MSVAVTVEGVSKSFGAHAALRGASLAAAPGELMALLGPSGSGKTTLLRLVAGLELAEAGRVLFDGADATALTLRERRVGFVFQHYALFKHMSVAENVAFGLKAKPRRERPSGADIKRRVGELLDLVRLPDMGSRFPAQLSGGQRQRVALARALAIEPRVLLLDEPFGALDATVRKELRAWLRELHGRTGHTTLFVTHDQDEALELADRVAVLSEGRVEQVGTPDEVSEAPATAFVASFLGEAAALPVKVLGGRVLRNGLLRDGGAADEPLVEAGALRRAPDADGAATLFLRPGGLRLGAPGPGTLRGTVAGVRRHGAGRRAEVAVEGLERRLEVDLGEAAPPGVGASVGLRVARASLFPREAS